MDLAERNFEQKCEQRHEKLESRIKDMEADLANKTLQETRILVMMESLIEKVDGLIKVLTKIGFAVLVGLGGFFLWFVQSLV